MQVDIPGAASGAAPSDTIQVKRYLRALKRRWPVVVAALFVGALLGWLTTPPPESVAARPRSGPFFRATHTLITDDTASQAISASGNTPAVAVPLAQAAFFVSTGDVPTRVAERLQIPVDQVAGNVKGTALDGVSSLAITAVGTDPDRVVALANTSAEELMKSLADANTQKYNQTRDGILTRLDTLKNTRSQLETQIQQTPSQADVLNAQLDSVVNQYRLTYEQLQQLATVPPPTAGLRTIEQATAVGIDEDEYKSSRDANLADPAAPVTAPPTTVATSKAAGASIGPASAPSRAATGGLLGLALGLGIVFLLDKFDTRLRQRVDVESATQLPVITEIPALARTQQHDFSVISDTAPRSRATEAYRIIRTSLLFSWTVSNLEPGGRVVMVTSASPNEGKTTTTANLATVLAEGGMSVLVINCDFRRPRIQKYLHDPVNPVERSIDVYGPDGAVRVHSTRIGHVDMVAGFGEQDEHANPLDIVSAQLRTVQRCRDAYDVVLLDTAPFLTTNDASELLAETDAVVLVVRSGRTKREAAARTAELLRRLDTNVVGVVFNGSSDSSTAEYYYNYYLDDASKRKRSSSGSGRNGRSGASTNGNGNGADGANGNGATNGNGNAIPTTVAQPPGGGPFLDE